MPKPVAVTVRSAPTPPCVLIAEDDLPIAECISSVVRDAGYTALVTYQGRQALDLARTHRPNLLIIDLMLPRLDGKAVIAALRVDAAASSEALPPIVLLTAASLAHARTAGADVVLRKPFQLEAVDALLRRFLGAPPAPATGVGQSGESIDD